MARSTVFGCETKKNDIFPLSIWVPIPESEDWTNLPISQAVPLPRRSVYDRIFVVTPDEVTPVAVYPISTICHYSGKSFRDIFKFDPSGKLTSKHRMQEGWMHISESIARRSFIFCRIEDQVPKTRIWTMLSFLNAHFKYFDIYGRMAVYNRMVNEYPDKLMHGFTFPSRYFDGEFYFHPHLNDKAKTSASINLIEMNDISCTISEQLMPRLLESIIEREQKFVDVAMYIKDELTTLRGNVHEVKRNTDFALDICNEIDGKFDRIEELTELCERMKMMNICTKKAVYKQANEKEKLAANTRAIFVKATRIEDGLKVLQCHPQSQS